MKENTFPRIIFYSLLIVITICAISTFFYFKPIYEKTVPLTIIKYIWFIFATILGLLIIFIIGYTIFNFLPQNNSFPPLVRFAISYGIGTGFLAISMFLCILIGIHTRLSFLPITIITIVLAIYFKKYKILKEDIKEIIKTIKRQKFTKLEYYCILILAIELFYLLSHWFIYPVQHYDGMYIWNHRAKLLYNSGNLKFLNDTDKAVYPLLVPLNLSFFYTLYCTDYQYSKILILFFFIFLITFFYYSLRSLNLNKTYSILLSTLLAIIGEVFDMATSVHADFPMTFFYTIGTIFIYKYFKTNNFHFLIYSTIFMGFMAWTKMEGFYIFIVNILILNFYFLFLLVKKRINYKVVLKRSSYTFLIGFLIYIPWLLFVILKNYESLYLAELFDIFDLSTTILNLTIISRRIFILILDPFRWGLIFWFFVFFIIIFKYKLIFKENTFFLFLLVFFHFLVYILVYIITPFDINTHMIQSYDRTLLHLTPISLFLIGVIFADDNKLTFDFEKDPFFRYILYIFVILIVISVIIIHLFFNPIFHFIRKIFPYYGIQYMQI